jgi:hypothetical protein
VEICQQAVNRLEFITGRNRQIGRGFFRDKFSVSRNGRFQRARRRRANRDDAAVLLFCLI